MTTQEIPPLPRCMIEDMEARRFSLANQWFSVNPEANGAGQ